MRDCVDQSVTDVLRRLVVIRHDTLEDLMRSVYRLDPGDDVTEGAIGGVTAEGADVEMTWQDFADSLADPENGGFGFADRSVPEPTIHLWHAPGADAQARAHLIGHEIGHLIGEPLEDGPPEEGRADAYGAVAAMVMGLVAGDRLEVFREQQAALMQANAVAVEQAREIEHLRRELATRAA